MLVLQILMVPEATDGLRFSTINKLLRWISPKVLTERLRELEQEGVLQRDVDASVIPPRVSYRLTKKGRDLQPVLEAIQAWGLKYGDNVVATCLGKGFNLCFSCPVRES